ncbi:hypothetical protein ACLB2K_064039 [Fragaria x ananassa]
MAKHAQTKQIICVTEEKEEEEEDRSKPVEEKEYNCRDNMEDQSCRDEQLGTEEIRGKKKNGSMTPPEGLKLAKRTKKKHTVENGIVIDEVNCNTNIWKLLDEKVVNHYKNWFDLNKNKNDDFQYWECCDGIIDITKDDLKRIIQGEIKSNGVPPNVERGSGKEEGLSSIPRHRGSGEAHYGVCQTRYDSTIYSLSQDLDPEK